MINHVLAVLLLSAAVVASASSNGVGVSSPLLMWSNQAVVGSGSGHSVNYQVSGGTERFYTRAPALLRGLLLTIGHCLWLKLFYFAQVISDAGALTEQLVLGAAGKLTAEPHQLVKQLLKEDASDSAVVIFLGSQV